MDIARSSLDSSTANGRASVIGIVHAASAPAFSVRSCGGFVTLPISGKEGAGVEFGSDLGDRSLPVRHCFGPEPSQG
jgi:hypothetical protein